MRTRLDSGVWAFGQHDGLLVGLLRGDMEHGWGARFHRIPDVCLPEIVRVLNVGGCWSDGAVTVRVDDGCSELSVHGRRLELDEARTARLQILASLPHRDGDTTAPAQQTCRVRSGRGVLRVDGQAIEGLPRAWSRVDAHCGGAVMVTVPTTAGTSQLLLPALPLLVAAAEASRDELCLALEVASTDRDTVSVVIDPAQAQQAAAEAQWLLATFERQFGLRR